MTRAILNGVSTGDLNVFWAVAKNGTLSAAAVILQQNVSTVTRRLTALEKDLGVQLVVRDARPMRLTEPGQLLFERFEQSRQFLDDCLGDLRENQRQPIGILRVVSFASVGRTVIAEHIPAFLLAYPKLKIALTLVHEKPRLDSFDVAIVAGESTESRTIARHLFDASVGVFASPAFIVRHGQPHTLRELAALPFVAFSHSGAAPDSFTRTRSYASESAAELNLGVADEKSADSLSARFSMQDVEQGAFLATNDLSTALTIVTAGHAAAKMSFTSAAPFLESGQLVPLMPGFRELVPMYAQLPSNRAIPQRTRLFIDFLRQEVASAHQLLEAAALAKAPL